MAPRKIKKRERLKKKRFKGGKGVFQSLKDTFTNKFFNKKHFYLNIPLGGMGTSGPQKGRQVGPQGYAYSVKSQQLRTNTQHGHLYIYVNRQVKGKKGKEGAAVIMIGLEKSAPGKKIGLW